MCSCPRLRKLGERSFFASDARELGRSRMFARILSLFLFRITYYNVGKFAPLMHADSCKKAERRTKSNAARLIASRTRLHILNYVVPFASGYFTFDAACCLNCCPNSQSRRKAVNYVRFAEMRQRFSRYLCAGKALKNYLYYLNVRADTRKIKSARSISRLCMKIRTTVVLIE